MFMQENVFKDLEDCGAYSRSSIRPCWLYLLLFLWLLLNCWCSGSDALYLWIFLCLTSSQSFCSGLSTFSLSFIAIGSKLWTDRRFWSRCWGLITFHCLHHGQSLRFYSEQFILCLLSVLFDIYKSVVVSLNFHVLTLWRLADIDVFKFCLSTNRDDD